MSWHFSQALVEEYSEANSLDGELSAPLNTNPMPQLYSQSDKMTEFLNRSQSGMTCEPLTENRGEELLMWFLEGFPARTSVVPEKEKESVGKDQDYGQKWPVSLAKYDHNTHLWKIAQHSLFEDLELCLETWPRWGMMHDGECWELTILGATIEENDSGLWPTIVKNEGPGGQIMKLTDAIAIAEGFAPKYYKHKDSIGKKKFNGKVNPEWAEWLMGWPEMWTNAFQGLETDKFQQWLDSHGTYSDLLN
jgi:hypothetical protein